VWHRSDHNLAPGRYRAACGWGMSIHDGSIWILKPLDIGPPGSERCHTCVTTAVDQRQAWVLATSTPWPFVTNRPADPNDKRRA
jgi:hypothetical protein